MTYVVVVGQVVFALCNVLGWPDFSFVSSFLESSVNSVFTLGCPKEKYLGFLVGFNDCVELLDLLRELVSHHLCC